MKVSRNNVLKETDIKNHAYCYFDSIINVSDLDLTNILLEEKSFGNILIIGLHIKLYPV